MAPFRTRDKDVVCANGGGGCAPPTPPVSFYAVQAFFQEHCIINKTCFARIIVIDLFKYHPAGSLFANGGATSPPTPVFFQAVQGHIKYHPASQNRTHMDPESLSEPMTKRLCLQMGGAAPPNPTAFFLRRAGLLSQEHRTMNKNWFKHIEVIDLFNPTMHAVYLQMVGLHLPKPYGPFQNP